ncbi:COX15/CtaA family protein [soil metagenome]
MGVTIFRRWREPTRGFTLGWAWASLVANTVIILTGGLVRLTGSGLGCPTWPRCTDSSFVPHESLGVHGAIEFGNRMLTYVLIAVAIGTWFAVRRWAGSSDSTRRLATVLAIGVPFQGVLGGITVLTDLNPWIVALHLMLSLGLVAGSTLLIVRVGSYSSTAVSGPNRALALVIYALLWVTVYVGTIVTGSGPHAGDDEAPRNNLRPDIWSHIHADLVFALVALTMIALFVFRKDREVRRWMGWLLAAQLAQGVIGIIQYRNDLPIVLVASHLVGAAVLISLTTRLVLATTRSSVRKSTLIRT